MSATLVLSLVMVVVFFALLWVIKKQREYIMHLKEASKISKSDARLVRRKDMV